MTDSFSLHDLKLLAKNNPGQQLAVRYLFCSSYEDFVQIVEDAIDWVSSEYTKTRQNRQDRSEDDLSVDVVMSLKSMGIQAFHDTAYGGHCDIVIEHGANFLWIGEAKIHRAYDWLVQGFQQLDTRYSTGMPKQNRLGMIIYCYNQDVVRVMQEWMVRLKEARPDVSVENTENPLVYLTKHTHKSGLPLVVRHTSISLFHSPQDKV